MLDEWGAQNTWRDERPLNFRLAVVDLETGEIVYERPVEGIQGSNDFWYRYFNEETGGFGNDIDDLIAYPVSALISLDESRFLLEPTHLVSESESILIELTDSEPIETPLDHVLLVIDDNTLLVTNATWRQSGQLMFYDIPTGQRTVIIEEYNLRGLDIDQLPSGYKIYSRRTDETGTLDIFLRHSESGDTMRYTIRIP